MPISRNINNKPSSELPSKTQIIGTAGETYDLDEIKNSVVNPDIMIWKWNPEASDEHKYPDPPEDSIELGNVWLSKRVQLNEL